MSAPVIDEALQRLHATAPTYDGGMSNHGPMVVEALETAGLERFVPTMTEQALRHLEPMPPAPEGPRTLGDGQESAWIEYYRRRLTDTALPEVVRAELPKLLPGLMAGATHGLIRLSHAVRGWQRSASSVRAEEVAHALGYWAAQYQTLPGEVGREPSLPLQAAVAGLPVLAEHERSRAGLILERVRSVDGMARFAEAIARADLRPGATSAFLSEMVGIAARMFLSASGAGFAYLHAITATAAVRPLLPYVAPEAELSVRQAVFHAVAALHTAHGGSAAWQSWEPTDVPPSVEALPRMAAESGGDHAIKLAVAVAQEYAVRPDEALLHAALGEINRVRG